MLPVIRLPAQIFDRYRQALQAGIQPHQKVRGYGHRKPYLSGILEQ